MEVGRQPKNVLEVMSPSNNVTEVETRSTVVMDVGWHSIFIAKMRFQLQLVI
jgi:hypothetical protein